MRDTNAEVKKKKAQASVNFDGTHQSFSEVGHRYFHSHCFNTHDVGTFDKLLFRLPSFALVRPLSLKPEVSQLYRHTVSAEAGINVYVDQHRQPRRYRDCVWPVCRRHLQPRTILGKTMFQKRRLTNPEASGDNAGPNRCEQVQRLPSSQLPDRFNLPAKRKRVADSAKILLDVVKESADWFPPLKSALGRVNALIKHYEVLVELVAVSYN